MARRQPALSPLGVHIANTTPSDRPQSRAMAWTMVAIIFFPWALLLGSGIAALAVKVLGS